MMNTMNDVDVPCLTCGGFIDAHIENCPEVPVRDEPKGGKTYRITIEYTTMVPDQYGPDFWDWPELLDLDPMHETFGVTVDEVETNQDHVREIQEQNGFAQA